MYHFLFNDSFRTNIVHMHTCLTKLFPQIKNKKLHVFNKTINLLLIYTFLTKIIHNIKNTQLWSPLTVKSHIHTRRLKPSHMSFMKLVHCLTEYYLWNILSPCHYIVSHITPKQTHYKIFERRELSSLVFSADSQLTILNVVLMYLWQNLVDLNDGWCELVCT